MMAVPAQRACTGISETCFPDKATSQSSVLHWTDLIAIAYMYLCSTTLIVFYKLHVPKIQLHELLVYLK